MQLNNLNKKYLFLIFLSIIFSIALTFATLELPLVMESVLEEFFPDYRWDFESRNALLAYARPIGYTCLAIVVGLIIVGFKTGKNRLSKLGSLSLFLPAFGNYAVAMFFLAGIGIFRVLWLPMWDVSPFVLMLGDVSYIPYWIIMQPIMILHEADFLIWIYWARGIGNTVVAVGLLIFCVGTFTWLYGKLEKKKVFDFWIYRYTRHPQYLGFILWSFGVLLLSALSGQIFGDIQPAPSLPWMISTILIICVALSEENCMLKQNEEAYNQYQKSAPFMLPLPRFVAKIITAPNKLLLKKEFPENKREILYTFIIYSTILIIISFFVVNSHLLRPVITRNYWTFY